MCRTVNIPNIPVLTSGIKIFRNENLNNIKLSVPGRKDCSGRLTPGRKDCSGRLIPGINHGG